MLEKWLASKKRDARERTGANRRRSTAWDPAGWTGTPNVDAQEFNPSYIPPPPWDVPPLAYYDDAAYAAQNCLPPAYYYDDAAYDAWHRGT